MEVVILRSEIYYWSEMVFTCEG